MEIIKLESDILADDVTDEIKIWLPVEFAREVVKAAMDKGVEAVGYVNIEEPNMAEVTFDEKEIDQVLECCVRIRK